MISKWCELCCCCCWISVTVCTVGAGGQRAQARPFYWAARFLGAVLLNLRGYHREDSPLQTSWTMYVLKLFSSAVRDIKAALSCILSGSFYIVCVLCRSAGVNNRTDGGWIPFSCLSFWVMDMLIHVITKGFSIISHTYWPTLISQIVCCNNTVCESSWVHTSGTPVVIHLDLWRRNYVMPCIHLGHWPYNSS